jgi:hypothetical protein
MRTRGRYGEKRIKRRDEVWRMAVMNKETDGHDPQQISSHDSQDLEI